MRLGPGNTAFGRILKWQLLDLGDSHLIHMLPWFPPKLSGPGSVGTALGAAARSPSAKVWPRHPVEKRPNGTPVVVGSHMSPPPFWWVSPPVNPPLFVNIREQQKVRLCTEWCAV